MRNTRYERGFSLLEVLIAVVLLGLALVALLAANSSFTTVNAAGSELSTAEFLVEQIKELTALLPVVDPEDADTFFGPEEAAVADYDDLDDFDNASFSPPINANRQVLANFATFNQRIRVERVNRSDFEQAVAGHTGFVRVTVTVSSNSKAVSSTSWIRAQY
ncbi:MAG: prepilin-type N-terminal cleavage/methylation domain-containing protein [Planctomycetota bacterium]|jgi:prepilin-type N-terminal cleavage/methylation domain-containing protein